MRLTSELAASDLQRSSRDIPGPHWDPRAVTLHEYLTDVAAARGEAGGAAAVDGRVSRCHYYLEKTLGCPNTFEGRRRELELLDPSSAPVSDDEVVTSLVSDVLPGGCLREYLEHACLACALGNSLFVHGALDPQSIGLVPADDTRFCDPAQPQPMRRVDGGVREWAREMNALLGRGLAAHLAHPEWDAARSTRGGEVLAALQNRCALWGRCIVSSAYADGGAITSVRAPAVREAIKQRLDPSRPSTASSSEEHAPAPSALYYEGWLADPRDTEVASWLLAGGIRRVVVGHKPSGDSPAVLSSSHTGVEVISADTSYADAADPALGRGAVHVAGVTLSGPSLAFNRARIFGVLANGCEHEAHLATLHTDGPAHDRPAEAADRLVGEELEGGWWVKARLKAADAAADRPRYLCVRGEGRKSERKEYEVVVEVE